MKFAFLFPGQGAQYPGMGKDFHDQFAVSREIFEEADDLLGQNFSRLIFEGPALDLTLTKNSQLAIYIVSMAIWRALAQQFPSIQPAVCAGLSLGEYTALTVSKKIAFADCLPLVQARAQFMNDACLAHEGSMQVILGLEARVIEKCIQEINPPHLVWVANLNCPGQVVIAGTKEGLAAGVEALLARGAKRALPLDVSGAFHSGLMKEAEMRLRPYLQEVSLHKTAIDCVMNVPGDYVSDLQQIRQFLMEQAISPVRWEQGVRRMVDQGIGHFIEMGPGKTLAGMNKRIGVASPTTSIEKVADLEGLSQCINC